MSCIAAVSHFAESPDPSVQNSVPHHSRHSTFRARTNLVWRNTLPPRGFFDVDEGRRQTGRRTLLKAGGFVAASGALGSIWACVTGAGFKSNTRKRAMWIRTVDRPTLSEKTADYNRFSGNDMFALYRPLKTPGWLRKISLMSVPSRRKAFSPVWLPFVENVPLRSCDSTTPGAVF